MTHLMEPISELGALSRAGESIDPKYVSFVFVIATERPGHDELGPGSPRVSQAFRSMCSVHIDRLQPS